MKYLYMTAIIPPAELETEIRQLQHAFSEIYGSAAALRPPVHITVTPPCHLEEDEVKAFRNSAKSLHGLTPFEIRVDGFDFFKSNRVLFLRVTQEALLQEIQKKLSSLLPVHETRPYRPHITVGYRDITKSAFKNIMNHYEARTFRAQFMVTEIQLWKHEEKKWRVEDRFLLNNDEPIDHNPLHKPGCADEPDK